MCVPLILFVCFVFNFNFIDPISVCLLQECFFMVNSPFGDLDTYTVDYIYNTFGKGALMDSYLMDFVIKYWKQDPEMGLVYLSR